MHWGLAMRHECIFRLALGVAPNPRLWHHRRDSQGHCIWKPWGGRRAAQGPHAPRGVRRVTYDVRTTGTTVVIAAACVRVCLLLLRICC